MKKEKNKKNRLRKVIRILLIIAAIILLIIGGSFLVVLRTFHPSSLEELGYEFKMFWQSILSLILPRATIEGMMQITFGTGEGWRPGDTKEIALIKLRNIYPFSIVIEEAEIIDLGGLGTTAVRITQLPIEVPPGQEVNIYFKVTLGPNFREGSTYLIKSRVTISKKYWR